LINNHLCIIKAGPYQENISQNKLEKPFVKCNYYHHNSMNTGLILNKRVREGG